MPGREQEQIVGCIKELADVLVLIDELPASWQRRAAAQLERVLEHAEREAAEQGLSSRERCEHRWAEYLAIWEKKDKAFAARLRRQRACIERFGEFAGDRKAALGWFVAQKGR
jgi:uncharacterized protein YmfQ (DUF2313 family)